MTPSESLLFMRWMSSGRLIGVEGKPHAPWLGSALTPELAARVVAEHNEWLAFRSEECPQCGWEWARQADGTLRALLEREEAP